MPTPSLVSTIVFVPIALGTILMPAPSPVSTSVFVLIVLAVAWTFVSAWRDVSSDAGRSRVWVPLVVGVGWLGVPAVVAGSGALGGLWDVMPPPGFAMMGALTLGTVLLAFSPAGGRLAAGVPMAGLVGFQFFRVPLEWVLHRLYSEHVIPVQMTYAGRNFDIVSGLSAAMVAFLLVAGRGGRALVLAWNLMGLALLANIVVIAVLSIPGPFRQFMNQPANRLPSMFPYVWLPTFLVQAALFGHLLVFRALASGKSR
jgi:hypothetical protein